MANRKRRRQNTGMTPNTLRFFVALMLLGVSIYIGVATSAGDFVVQYVVAPLMNIIAPKALADFAMQPTPSPVAVNTSEPMPEEANRQVFASASVQNETSQSKELSIQGYTAYAIQFGVFATQENAEQLSDSIATKGAAGYIYEDGDQFRVLGAAYTTKEEATEVKAQLLDVNNMQTAIYQITAPAMAMKVTAAQGRAAAVEASFSALQEVCTSINALAIAVDKGTTKAQQAKDELLKHSGALNDCMIQIGTANGIAGQLYATLGECRSVLQEGAYFEGDDKDFSPSLKVWQIQILCNFASLLNDISKELSA